MLRWRRKGIIFLHLGTILRKKKKINNSVNKKILGKIEKILDKKKLTKKVR